MKQSKAGNVLEEDIAPSPFFSTYNDIKERKTIQVRHKNEKLE